MISMEKIDSLWAAIQPQKGNTIARRVDPEHPLDLFIGYDEEGQMQLILITDCLPELPRSSQQVVVRGNQRSDGMYAICFSLLNIALKETFISLCWDIITCTYEVESEKQGVSRAIQRFATWQILLAEESELKMSDSLVKGLLGELAVLYCKCLPKYGASHALTGWVGPLRADRDFEYEDSWLEVKAVSLSKESIDISSFDQLDIDRRGYLIICRIEKTSDADPQKATLNMIINKIKEAIINDQQALSTLLVRLRLSGYRSDDERTDEPYIIHRFESYIVDNEFPRIRRSELNAAILGGEYSLSIAAIQTHRSEYEVNYAEL